MALTTAAVGTPTDSPVEPPRAAAAIDTAPPVEERGVPSLAQASDALALLDLDAQLPPSLVPRQVPVLTESFAPSAAREKVGTPLAEDQLQARHVPVLSGEAERSTVLSTAHVAGDEQRDGGA